MFDNFFGNVGGSHKYYEENFWQFFTVLKDEGARYGQKEPVKEIIKWKVSKTSEAEKKKKSPV